MAKNRVVFLLISFSLIFSVACTTGYCRNPKVIEGKIMGLEEEKKPDPSALKKVFVYKYDGSLQCGMGTAIPVDSMQKELLSIQVFSASKKPDGLMHIQSCGSPTGMANVFEILETDLPEAEKYGFKKWEFN